MSSLVFLSEHFPLFPLHFFSLVMRDALLAMGSSDSLLLWVMHCWLRVVFLHWFFALWLWAAFLHCFNALLTVSCVPSLFQCTVDCGFPSLFNALLTRFPSLL